MLQALRDWGVAIAVVALVSLTIGECGGSGPALATAAPPFQLSTLTGEALDIEAMHGQTVVLNFWASWCGPCRQEIPDFSRFSSAHPEVVVWGVAVDSGDEADVRRSAKALGIDYTVAVADAPIVRDYNIDVFPTTVVIDSDGLIRHVQAGMMTYAQLERVTAP